MERDQQQRGTEGLGEDNRREEEELDNVMDLALSQVLGGGIDGEEMLDTRPFLKPEVPQQHLPHPEQQAGEGWGAIDQLSVWDCFLCLQGLLEEVPLQHRHVFCWSWGVVCERILNAYSKDVEIDLEGSKMVLLLTPGSAKKAWHRGAGGQGTGGR